MDHRPVPADRHRQGLRRQHHPHAESRDGGYVILASTLSDLHLSVSQWKTDAGWPYRLMQFRVPGLRLEHQLVPSQETLGS